GAGVAWASAAALPRPSRRSAREQLGERGGREDAHGPDLDLLGRGRRDAALDLRVDLISEAPVQLVQQERSLTLLEPLSDALLDCLPALVLDGVPATGEVQRRSTSPVNRCTASDHLHEAPPGDGATCRALVAAHPLTKIRVVVSLELSQDHQRE